MQYMPASSATALVKCRTILRILAFTARARKQQPTTSARFCVVASSDAREVFWS
jgi:hypothetical protein